MNLCQKCVLPVETGRSVCEDCRTYAPQYVNWAEKENELRKIVEEYRGTGPTYDFIVPLTGGKDSSFVLYYMVKKMGGRVLAYTWDNDLIRANAWDNIRRAVAATGVDHKIFKWDSDKMVKVYRATFKKVGKVCYCPVFLALNVLPTAIELKVPLIVTGFSEGQREMDHRFSIPPQSQQKDKTIKFHSIWSQFFAMALDEYEPESSDAIKEHLLAHLGRYTRPESSVDSYPVMLPLSNYVNWTSVSDLEATLSQHLNWRRAADAFTHTSCFIEPIKGYLENKRNLTEIACEISCLIRAGSLTRDEGLKELELLRMNGHRPDEIQAFCKFLSISVEDFDFYACHKTVPPPYLKEQIEKFRKDLVDTLAWIMGIKEHKALIV